MKIVVSHSGRQHAYRLINSLVELGHDVVFCTAFATKKTNWLHKILPKTFSKRHLNNHKVDVKSWPHLEIFRKILLALFGSHNAKIQYHFERTFDKFVAQWLRSQAFDVFIGYEISSIDSFKVAKSRGKITILDLAQIHYKEIECLSQTYDALSHLSSSNDKLRTQINSTKEEELRICDHIFAISNFVKTSLIKHGVAPDKVSLVRIGTDNNHSDIGIKNETFTILYVGTLRRQKGTDMLIEAVRQLREEYQLNMDLLLIGNVTDDPLNSLIRQYHFIKHLSFMPYADLKQHYLSSNVFCIPSLLDSWGMVVLEAMSFGLPVVVSQNTGAKETVEEGGGIVIEAGNLIQLKNALKLLYDDRELLNKLGGSAKEISKRYSFQLYKTEIKLGIEKANLVRHFLKH